MRFPRLNRSQVAEQTPPSGAFETGHIPVPPRRSRCVTLDLLDESDAECTCAAPSSPFVSVPISPELSSIPNVSDKTILAMRESSGFQELVDTCPEDVIRVLKELAVVKVGTFQVADSEVLKAFGQDCMLTLGSELLDDPDWQEKWKDNIKTRIGGRRSISVGWEEKVTLGAYAVNIKDVAGRDRGALLKLLLQKYWSGATSKKVWEFPAVRAVIDYHWQHWARRFLLACSTLFLCWIISFGSYLAIYIEADVGASGMGKPSSWRHLLAAIVNLTAFVFMCPFAVMECWTMIEQGRRWIQLRNIADICAIALQTLIFVCHLMNCSLTEQWFANVLALQCVFLFTKLQTFGRILNSGASFCGILFSVLYDVRYLLTYILFTGISGTLCLGALYKHDTGYGVDKKHHHFRSIRNSFVTTFQIIFGSFDMDFVFDADHPWLKICFFFGFQMLMTITMLNLLIAVMTESYSKLAGDRRIRHNRGRASMIDELEALNIPTIFSTKLHPYIHFLIVEKKPKELSYRPSMQLGQTVEGMEQLRLRMDDMSNQLKTIVQLLHPRNKADQS